MFICGGQMHKLILLLATSRNGRGSSAFQLRCANARSITSDPTGCPTRSSGQQDLAPREASPSRGSCLQRLGAGLARITGLCRKPTPPVQSGQSTYTTIADLDVVFLGRTFRASRPRTGRCNLSQPWSSASSRARAPDRNAATAARSAGRRSRSSTASRSFADGQI